MPENIGQFADLFDGFQPELQISAFMHDNREFGVLSQQLTGRRAEIAGYVQDLAHGMDAIAAGTSHIRMRHPAFGAKASIVSRSEEHTSELQSLMRISYAVFCLKKKNSHTHAAQYLHPLKLLYYTVSYYMVHYTSLNDTDLPSTHF